jgi:shikimate kinase
MVNIYLIGFMGAGKSTIGPLLAERLGSRFEDADTAIERRAGRTISEIFSEEGETAFRALEVAYVRETVGPLVIGLGGGAFMTEAVRGHVAAHGISVFLDWPIEVLRARAVGDPNRPLARDPVRFEALFRARLPIYRTARVVWRSRPPHREDARTVVDDLSQRLQPLLAGL